MPRSVAVIDSNQRVNQRVRALDLNNLGISSGDFLEN